jgi:hypothetical protein
MHKGQYFKESFNIDQHGSLSQDVFKPSVHSLQKQEQNISIANGFLDDK